MKAKYTLLPLLAFWLCHCSPSRVDKRDNVEVPPKADEPAVDNPIAEIPLLQLPASGTQMRFLDAVALTEVYSRVFTKDASNRWKGCGNEAQWCQKSMFSKEEAKFLGTFSLLDGVDSFRVQKDFTLNYTRNLRATLYRECRNLVDLEWQRLNTPDGVKQNLLIHRQGIPTAVDLDQFSRRLFGLSGTDIVIDNMASEYQAAFAASVGTRKDAETLKSGYVVACMALAMDPAVFLY